MRDRPSPATLERGSSTAVPTNVSYRLGKLRNRRLLSGTWLDCGCADGGYTTALAEGGAERVIGLEIEIARLRQARTRVGEGGSTRFVNAASEFLPFADQTFDGILVNEVLEHVEDEQCTLREIHRVLRPGGHLVLFGPNRWFPFEGHGMTVRGMKTPFPMPVLPWIPRRWALKVMSARNYWPHELADLVRGAGLQVIEVTSTFPVFEVYPWLPPRVIHWYKQRIVTIEQLPIIHRFGVSTCVIARREP
jgi:SAM-dependent methyltransferase